LTKTFKQEEVYKSFDFADYKTKERPCQKIYIPSNHSGIAMALEDLASKYSYYVLARKNPGVDYVFAVENNNPILAGRNPSPMTIEQADRAIGLLKKKGYDTLLVQYNPYMPGGAVNLGVLALNDAMPELLSLTKKVQKAARK
jgi:hypothetical protein